MFVNRSGVGTRITPAYAGTTFSYIVVVYFHQDHPRLRGDHSSPGDGRDALAGSPPLTRGPRVPPDKAPRAMGITPAYAGTTKASEMMSDDTQDHPRLRGDHEGTGQGTQSSPGSPPLTRGPRISRNRRWRCPRITPAYAGTTHRDCVDVGAAEDHPRLRGDHTKLGLVSRTTI